MSEVAGAIIAGAASVIGSGVQAVSTGKMNKKSIKFNKEQNALNRQHAWDMFHAANQYNSPQQAMQRLKLAGLNPWLVYSDMNKVGAASPQGFQSHSAPQLHKQDYGKAVTEAVSAMMAQKNLQLMDAQKNKTDAETRNIDANTDRTVTLLPFEKGNIQANTNSLIQGIEKSKKEIDLMATSQDKMMAELNYIVENTNMTRQQILNLKVQFNETLAKINQLISQTKLNDAIREAQNLSNWILRNTGQGQIDAQNVVNKLTVDSKGLNQVAPALIPGTIIGGALKGGSLMEALNNTDNPLEKVNKKVKEAGKNTREFFKSWNKKSGNYNIQSK